MVCPYRKETIHVDRMADGYIISPAQDVERFAKCQGRECPFYTEQIKGEPHCMRAGKERSGKE